MDIANVKATNLDDKALALADALCAKKIAELEEIAKNQSQHMNHGEIMSFMNKVKFYRDKQRSFKRAIRDREENKKQLAKYRRNH